MQRIVFYTISIIVFVLFTELLSGYFVGQVGKFSEPAVFKAVKIVKKSFDSQFKRRKQIARKHELAADNYNNPFVSNPPDEALVRFHPFIDFSNAHILDADGKTVKSAANDFFGFRNNKNYYFEKRNADDLVILVSGGSECAGYSHYAITISDAIKSGLQSYTRKNVITINLCMNSYVLAHEIQSYVHLGYQIRPDIVISHSGWNDAIYGLLVSEEFLTMGLIYNKWQEHWLEPLYSKVKIKPPQDVFSDFNKNAVSLVSQAYIRQARKYKKIANDNGAVFLLGIQNYNPKIKNDGMGEIHKAAHNAMAVISSSIPKDLLAIDFSKINGDIGFVDSVHTDQTAVNTIAEKYVRFILLHHSDLL